MLVRAEEVCFIGGSRRRVGDVFEYSGKPAKFLTVMDAVTEPVSKQDHPEEDDTDLDNAQLRVRLGEYGVKVAPNTSRTKMLIMLAEAEGR